MPLFHIETQNPMIETSNILVETLFRPYQAKARAPPLLSDSRTPHSLPPHTECLLRIPQQPSAGASTEGTER